jgi:hypothetical protein
MPCWLTVTQMDLSLWVLPMIEVNGPNPLQTKRSSHLARPHSDGLAQTKATLFAQDFAEIFDARFTGNTPALLENRAQANGDNDIDLIDGLVPCQPEKAFDAVDVDSAISVQQTALMLIGCKLQDCSNSQTHSHKPGDVAFEAQKISADILRHASIPLDHHSKGLRLAGNSSREAQAAIAALRASILPEQLSKLGNGPIVVGTVAKQPNQNAKPVPLIAAPTFNLPTADINSVMALEGSTQTLPVQPFAPPVDGTLLRLSPLIAVQHIEQIRETATHSKVLRLTLDPEGLGKVDIVLRDHDGALTCDVIAELASTAAALAEDGGRMAKALADWGSDGKASHIAFHDNDSGLVDARFSGSQQSMFDQHNLQNNRSTLDALEQRQSSAPAHDVARVDLSATLNGGLSIDNRKQLIV